VSDRTGIQWTDATWNPLRGCTRVSEGCRHCYAELQAIRQVNGGYRGLVKSTARGPRWTGEVRLVEHLLDAPLRWKRPRRIFVNSMSDLFHEAVPDEWVDRIFDVMLRTEHTYQILTKRPHRMRDYVRRFLSSALLPSVLEQVWLGTSVENRAALSRLDRLRETPAPVRFVSFEPLLEDLGDVDLRGVTWAVIGGESGPAARPCAVSWLRSLLAQCQAAGAAVFVKQLGAHPTNDRAAMVLRDRKGGDVTEWPEDLRVREMPSARPFVHPARIERT
jgi:protein gp37